MLVEEGGKQTTLRFSVKKVGKLKKPMEVIHFYSSSGGKVFHARCERGVVLSFLERLGKSVKQSRTGKTIYLEGVETEELLRKLIILASCRQCMKSPTKMPEVAEVIAGLGEFETIFWYTKAVEEHEKKSFRGVCRVAKAFRILHRIY